MGGGLEEVGAEDLGENWDARVESVAIDGLEALAAADAAQERWVVPLVRAIRRRRLRLPTLSPTVHKIIQIIESSEVDIDELAAAVSADPSLASRIMGVANSSYFRGATEVPNVREALMRMGMREARTIVVLVALRATVLRAPGVGDVASTLWRHSLLCAAATQEIVADVPEWESAGFLAGLVHDIGQLVILAFAGELPAWQEDGDAPDDAAVKALCDAAHAPLGALVLGSWSFPSAFCEAVLHHHEADALSGPAADLARAMMVGHGIAMRIDAGWPDDPDEVDADLLRDAVPLGLDAERLTDIAMEAEASFEALDKIG